MAGKDRRPLTVLRASKTLHHNCEADLAKIPTALRSTSGNGSAIGPAFGGADEPMAKTRKSLGPVEGSMGTRPPTLETPTKRHS